MPHNSVTDNPEVRTWTDRDELCRKRADDNPCCPRHFFGLFPNEKACYRRLDTLRERGLLRLIGEVMIGDTGRPEKVFCNGWKPKQDHLRHEVLLTDFLLLYPEAEVVRGWSVDKRVRPDAEMTLFGRRFFVELDTGEQSYAQVQRRQRQAYADVQDFLLYVTMSERRLEGLLTHADQVKGIALFTTLDKAKSDPRGPIWVDGFGETAALGQGG